MIRRVLSIGIAALAFVGCSSSGSAAKTQPDKSATTVGNGQTGSDNGGESETKPVSNVDPCTLLTQAEAQDAVGFAVKGGDRNGVAGTQSCNFFGSDMSKLAQGVSVQMQPPVVFNGTYDHISDGTLDAAYNLKKLDGLGDKAFTQTNKGQEETTIGVFTAFEKNGAYIYINVNADGLTVDEALAKELDLAKKVAARL